MEPLICVHLCILFRVFDQWCKGGFWQNWGFTPIDPLLVFYVAYVKNIKVLKHPTFASKFFYLLVERLVDFWTTQQSLQPSISSPLPPTPILVTCGSMQCYGDVICSGPARLRIPRAFWWAIILWRCPHDAAKRDRWYWELNPGQVHTSWLLYYLPALLNILLFKNF